jgi:acyl-CoA hydrolase
LAGEIRFKLISPAEAARKVRNGDRIYLGSMCSEPKKILKALEASFVEDVEIIQFMSGPEASRHAGAWGRFRTKTFFVEAVAGNRRRVGIQLHSSLSFPDSFFFRNRRIPIDVAIIQVSNRIDSTVQSRDFRGLQPPRLKPREW